MYIQSKKVVIGISFLYHGTIDKYAADIIYNGVNLAKSKKHLDFGPGFYTTPDEQFAIDTAKRRAKSYNAFNKENPVNPKVLIFECDDSLLATLTQKTFESADTSWAQFVLANRCENKSVHERYDNNLDARYDIVSGPTADGKGTFTPVIDQVSRGECTIENADYSAFAPSKGKRWGKQISFHTNQSLSCIRLKGVL